MPDASKNSTAVAEEKIVQFLDQWLSALAQLARFTRGNRLVVKQTAELHASLAAATDERGELSFRDLHGMLLVNGGALSIAAQDSVTVGAFLVLMLRHNLRSLRLRATVSLDDFNDLLDRLSCPPDGRADRFLTTTHQTFGADIEVELYTPLSEPTPGPAEEEIASPAFATPPPPPPESLRWPSAADKPKTSGQTAGASREICVIVRVGPLALFGAEVVWAKSPDAPAWTQGEKGATLVAAAGEQELLIRYDEYQVRRRVVVEEQNQTVEIDLQKMFEFANE